MGSHVINIVNLIPHTHNNKKKLVFFRVKFSVVTRYQFQATFNLELYVLYMHIEVRLDLEPRQFFENNQESCCLMVLSFSSKKRTCI